MIEPVPPTMAPVTAVIFVFFIGGLLIHSFIAIPIIIQWLHGKPVTPVDQVLTSLGISRMFLQIFSLIDLLLSVYQHGYLDPGTMIHPVIDSLFIFFNYSSIWFATLFSVIFCLKIATFSHGFFLCLKEIVSQRVVSLIVSSLVVCTGYMLMYLFFVAANVEARNVTNVSDVSQIRVRYIILFLLGNTVPIGIYCSSSVLLIFSLYLHTNRMRTNDNSIHFRLDAYYMAINTMAFCLICYIFTIISNLFVIFYISVHQVLWIHIILNVFPIIHSILLIYKTSYLRQYFTLLYNSIAHCMLLTGESNSGEVVVTVT